MEKETIDGILKLIDLGDTTVTFGFDSVLNAWTLEVYRKYKGERIGYKALIPRDLYDNLKNAGERSWFWNYQFDKALHELSDSECEKLLKEKDNGDH